MNKASAANIVGKYQAHLADSKAKRRITELFRSLPLGEIVIRYQREYAKLERRGEVVDKQQKFFTVLLKPYGTAKGSYRESFMFADIVTGDVEMGV